MQGDRYFDAGEVVVYKVAFQNSGDQTLFDVSAWLECIDPMPGGVDPCIVLSPLPQNVRIGDLPPATPGATQGMSATAAAFNLRVDENLQALIPNPADRVVILRVQLHWAGWDVLTDDVSFEFTHALQADDWRFHYCTDYPQGTRLCIGGANNGDPCTPSPTDACALGGGVCESFAVAVDLVQRIELDDKRQSKLTVLENDGEDEDGEEGDDEESAARRAAG